MTTTKVFIGTRFDSDRVKALDKIAKKLHISKNAVIENAFDIYAEDVLGVITLGDNTNDQKVITPTNDIIQKYEDRIAALELKLSELQAKVLSPSVNTKEAKVLSPSEQPIKPTIEQPIEQPKTLKPTEPNEDNIFDSLDTEQPEAIEPTIDIFDDVSVIEQLGAVIEDSPIEPEAISDNAQVKLTRAEFETKFNLDADAYSKVVNHNKVNGCYTANDGSKWYIAGTRKDRTWQNYPVTRLTP